MPKRSYQANDPRLLTHRVYRPLLRTLDTAEGINVTKHQWHWHHKPSPFVTGKAWIAMRQATGRSGREACFKPLVYRKEEIKFGGAPKEDLLRLPEKKFFEEHKKPTSTKKVDQSMYLPPSMRVPSPELYEKQPVLARHNSYSDHHTTPPVRSRARGVVRQPKNSFIQRLRSPVTA